MNRGIVLCSAMLAFAIAVPAAAAETGKLLVRATDPDGRELVVCWDAHRRPGERSDRAIPPGLARRPLQPGWYKVFVEPNCQASFGWDDRTRSMRARYDAGAPRWRARYYGGGLSFESGRWVQVRAGRTTRVELVLDLLPGITGAVFDRSGVPLSSVCVTAEDRRGRTIARAMTDELHGVYRLDILRRGRVTIRLRDCIFGANSAGMAVDPATGRPWSLPAGPGATHRGVDGRLDPAGPPDLAVTRVRIGAGSDPATMAVEVEIRNRARFDANVFHVLLEATDGLRSFEHRSFPEGLRSRHSGRWTFELPRHPRGDLFVSACALREAMPDDNGWRAGYVAPPGGQGIWTESAWVRGRACPAA